MQLKISSPKIWLATEPVDFRRSIDGLCEYIKDHFSLALKESIFVFHSKDRKKLKVLVWHKNGFVLVYKRLESGCFKYCPAGNPLVTLDDKQLSWLLAGLDWHLMSHWNELSFDDYF